LNITRFPLKAPQSYELNEQVPWLKTILLELNENVDSKLPEEFLETSHLDVNLEIVKKHKGSYGEYLLVSGKLNTHYHTQCVRTLSEMTEDLEVEFKACYLEDTYQDNEEFRDQVDIFMDGEVYELYFYENRLANIQLLIHEQIFLNYNQYPVSDYDAELGWAKSTTDTKQ